MVFKSAKYKKKSVRHRYINYIKIKNSLLNIRERVILPVIYIYIFLVNKKKKKKRRKNSYFKLKNFSYVYKKIKNLSSK